MTSSSVGPRAAATAFLLSLLSCVGDTPPNPIAAPDLARLTVFFPIDNLVIGRGSPGPVPKGFRFVYIKPHPSRNVFSFVPVNQETGEFNFRVAGTGNDVLEIAFAEDDNPLARRGAPTFIEVPLQPASPQSFYCCKRAGEDRGRCHPSTETMCSNNIALPACTEDGDCSYLSGDHIGLGPTDVTVTPPNEAGRVTVAVDNPRLALHLIRLQNRGFHGIGGPDPRYVDYAIADELGRASFKPFLASGDHEIVVRVYELNGYVRSREHAIYVPDAPLAGLDVVGVVPLQGLRAGTTGRVGIRFAPYGVDLRGMCPPSSEDGEVLCFCATGKNGNFNGGLDYADISITDVKVDGMNATLAAPLRDAGTGSLKFTDGDVLAPEVSIVVIIDKSENSDDDDVDGNRDRFKAAINFVRASRKRDKVAVIATGAPDPMGAVRKGDGFSVRAELGDRETAQRALEALQEKTGEGTNDLNAAIVEAATMIAKADVGAHGRILVLSASQPQSMVTTDATLEVISENTVTGREAYPVNIVVRRLDDPDVRTELDTYAGFTGGSFSEINSPSEFLTSVAEATGRISGAFVLSYDLAIPATSGNKTAQLTFRASLTLANTAGTAPTNLTQEASFAGDLELRDNPNP